MSTAITTAIIVARLAGLGIAVTITGAGAWIAGTNTWHAWQIREQPLPLTLTEVRQAEQSARTATHAAAYAAAAFALILLLT